MPNKRQQSVSINHIASSSSVAAATTTVEAAAAAAAAVLMTVADRNKIIFEDVGFIIIFSSSTPQQNFP